MNKIDMFPLPEREQMINT